MALTVRRMDLHRIYQYSNRFFSAAGASTKNTFQRTFPVDIKSKLDIDLVKGDVVVSNGPLDAIKLSVDAKVPEDECAFQHANNQVQLKAKQVDTVYAEIPERYCALSTSSKEGDVSVKSITEASLEVLAHGAIKLGNIRGTTVSLENQTGDISGSASAKAVDIHSKDGDISMKKVVGKQVHIETGGHINIGSVYSDITEILSTHGNVYLGIIGSSMKSKVCARSGSVEVRGVSGSVDIESAENANIHINKDAKDVSIASSGDIVNLTLETGMKLGCHLECKDIELANEIIKEQTKEGTFLRVGNIDNSSLMESLPQLHVNAKMSNLKLSASSWLDKYLKK